MKYLLLNSQINRMTVFSITLLFLVNLIGFSQVTPTRSYFAEGKYLLRNVATGKYLTVSGSKYENGTSMSQAAYTKDYNQQFYVSSFDDNMSVTIGPSVNENFLVGVNETVASNANGGAIKLLEDLDSSSRVQWKLIPTARPRVFTLLSLDNNSKRAIGVLNSTATQIVQWKIQTADTRFQWEFVPIVEEGWYALQNVGSGLVMTTKQAAKTNGTPITVAEYDTSDVENNPISMKFQVIESSANVYKLTPGHTYSKKWISVAANGNNNGSELIISSANESLQNFEIKYVNDITKGFDDETFTIRSIKSQKLLGVIDEESGNVVQDDSPEEDEYFQWRLIDVQPAKYLQEGSYVIENVGSNLVMDVAGGKLQNGTGIVQYEGNDAESQTFEVRINDDCKYQILPVIAKSTKYVTVTNKALLGVADNTTLLDAIYAGEEIIADEEDESDIYVLKSNQLSLGVLGKNRGLAVVAQNTTNPSNSFKWRFIPTDYEPYLTPGLYTIQNVSTNLMMDVAAAQTTNGSKVIQYNRSNAVNQKFEVSINDNGQYNIAPVYVANKWLSVTGGSLTNRNPTGTQLFINDANKTDVNVSWGINKQIVDENNEDENIFSIRSLDPSSKKDLGIYNVNDRRVVQLDGDPATNSRLQWRFIPTTKAASSGRMSAELLSEAESENLDKGLTVMPNPLRGDFEVRIEQFETNEPLTLSIVDLQGKPVYQNNIGTERSLKLNTQQLQMKFGTYLMEVNNGQQRYTTKLMVIE